MAPSSTRDQSGLTVAVTGPTGTFGFALMPVLEAEEAVSRVVGIARRPFDPAEHGWHKMTYSRGDVRDESALESAFAGADVVVHLAFLITGTAGRQITADINMGGTLNSFRAAAAAGARRFVYASSVAAYGFHDDNPDGLTEEWPARPAAHLFYAQEKAELERLLLEEAGAQASTELYVLRPPIVLGPHAVGAKDILPPVLESIAGRAAGALGGLPVSVPLPVPAIPLQLIHEDDVASAFLACIRGDGPSGTYNIAGDGVVTARDVARELNLSPLPFPLRPVQRGAAAVAGLPLPSFVPPLTEWAEALTRPVIMDTSKAREQLGWRPRFTGLEALRATIGPSRT